ncbi:MULTISPECIES: YqzL family protein [unclassified Candidatus Frackibacter]|nr:MULTISPECIES: YqzL family protein [unclassified Candidatus Frackibacter]
MFWKIFEQTGSIQAYLAYKIFLSINYQASLDTQA